MAVSLNSVVGFNSKLQAKYQHDPRIRVEASLLKATHLTSARDITGFRILIKGKKWRPHLLVANSDRAVTDPSDKDLKNSEIAISDGESSAVNLLVANSAHAVTDPSDKDLKNSEIAISDGESSAVNLQSLDSPTRESQLQAGAESEFGLQTPEISNGSSVISSDLKQYSSSGVKSTPKRSSLTAREKLRAARVLSRYTESKASKPELGSKVLEAMRESDRGKRRSGLPEAPTNLFDDSKRGMPKNGLTFEFPGGVDAFIIAFSFVFISTVMFATTYIVWKVGAIHFNEY